MRLVFDVTRRFRQRPHYEGNELNLECEAIVSGFLSQRHGRVSFPISTDDLWALLESVTDDVDFADLREEGDEVHGVTEFHCTGRPSVKIARELVDEPRRVNRLRTTITHEFGHVKFHGFLYALELESEKLFVDLDRQRRDPVCRRENMLGNTVDWMEWQAGYVSGGILMPASAVRALVADALGPTAVPLQREDPRLGGITNSVCERFTVSADAARMRLTKLGYVVPTAGMLTLSS